jgi:hypothetical protein
VGKNIFLSTADLSFKSQINNINGGDLELPKWLKFDSSLKEFYGTSPLVAVSY